MTFGIMQSLIMNHSEDANLMQVGVGTIIASCTSESPGDQAAGCAAGGILVGTGYTIATSSVPASWSPAGWVGLGIGLML